MILKKKNKKTIVIAEAGVNHNGDMSIAKKLIDAAATAKADYVKTSTGFSGSGATLTAVKIMKKTVKGHTKIKTSGGIRNYATALKYIEAGVERIGTSSGVDMMNNQNLKVAN